MAAPYVEITFAPDGTAKVEVHGAHGKACDELVKPAQGLGEVRDRRFKPEYYRAPEKATDKAKA